MLKKILLTMAVFAIIMIPLGGVISMALTAICGGGVTESYLYPLYGGIILLAGLVTGCTCVILEKLSELQKLLQDQKK